MANLHKGETVYGTCVHCHKLYPHLTGQYACECKKTDVGTETDLLADFGLGLLRPTSHSQLGIVSPQSLSQQRRDYYLGEGNRDWTDQEKLEMIKNQAREIARLAEARKVYNQPSFVGILVKLYRDIRKTKLFINLGKDYRDEGNIQKEDKLV